MTPKPEDRLRFRFIERTDDGKYRDVGLFQSVTIDDLLNDPEMVAAVQRLRRK